VVGGRFVVAGAGIAGAAAARVLLERGASVRVIDRRDSEALQALRDAGAEAVLADPGAGALPAGLLDGVDEVVVSPGLAPHTAIARAAAAAGLPVYSEPELAWRLRGPDAPPWLAVTGTNGKSTTVTMLADMLRAGGLRAAAIGNIGVPLVDATADRSTYDVVAVELTSFQLYWSQTMAPEGGAWLNLAEDHLEWHLTMEAYAEAKTPIWRGAANGGVAVGNLDDPEVTRRLAAVEGHRVGFSVRQEPGPGRFARRDGWLVASVGAELVPVIEEDRIRPAGLHNVANALAAAALASWYGVPATAIGAALSGYTPEPHRNALVATVDGVAYVDDSKATNPHAAHASLSAYPRIVWIAGGQLKGVDVDGLVAAAADRLVGVVLLGVDREEIAVALARHAPRVPVVDVAKTDDGAMAEVVRAAAALARPGDTVLLAPAAASKDMFVSYSHRGDAFAEAVRAR
jgi:UDP-N-acetylmuramoylalanine--D-glutamate ligase